MKDSPEYTVITNLSEVISKHIPENITEISDALLKENLIPSDIMNEVMKEDHTPTKKAEILLQALAKEVKNDDKVLHRFMAILSTYGRYRLLVRMLSDFLPEHGEQKHSI